MNDDIDMIGCIAVLVALTAALPAAHRVADALAPNDAVAWWVVAGVAWGACGVAAFMVLALLVRALAFAVGLPARYVSQWAGKTGWRNVPDDTDEDLW